MIKNLAILFALLLSVNSFQVQAEEFVLYGRSHSHVRGDKHGNQDFRDKHNYPRKSESDEAGFKTGTGPDAKLVAAVTRKRRVNFVEGAGMVVVKLLPDDRDGLRHQKWVVRLSNGATMEAVYNIDMCEYVPLKVGDQVAMGGEFIWTNRGALLHWLHYDPSKRRPDGYVEHNGKVYCGGR